MRAIDKRIEPASLATHRCQRNATYNNLPSQAKTILKASLLAEQGYICCYCMGRINAKTMRVEHCKPQKHAAEALSYANLLAACHGNTGCRPEDQHCDVRKGEAELSFNPAMTSCGIVASLQYPGDGRITSTSPQWDAEINTILNLNYSRLRENRVAVLQLVLDTLKKTLGRATRTSLETLRRKWASLDGEGKHKAYCGVALYYLEKKLRRAT